MGILKAVGLGSKIIYNGSKALVAGSIAHSIPQRK